MALQDGRELHHIRTEMKQQEGYLQTFEVYGCEYCSGYEHKEEQFLFAPKHKLHTRNKKEKNTLLVH